MSKIIFTNGTIDPWSFAGYYTPDSDREILVRVIENAAHHQDLRAEE